MSYNPQQSQPQSQPQEHSGSGYPGYPSPQNQNSPYNAPIQQPPIMPASNGVPGAGGGIPPYTAPISNSKKVSPALVIGGGIALLLLMALAVFLLLQPGGNTNSSTNNTNANNPTSSSTSSNANNGISSTSGLLPGSGVAKPASGGIGNDVGSVNGNGSGTFKNTISGKVGETLKLDDYSVTVYGTKWVDITPNTEIIMSDQVGRYKTKPEDADFCLDWEIQRTGNNGYASRSPDGIATSGTYILSTATQTSEKVGKDRKIFGPFQPSNGLKPAFATKYRMEMQEVSRGWNCFIAPKSLATEPDFTFTYQTVTYPIQGQGLSATRVPFIFKFKLS
jgi:hypothetical protein